MTSGCECGGQPLDRLTGWGCGSTVTNATQIASLRASGASWQQIADRMGIGVGTACRAIQQASKDPAESQAVSG